MQFKSMRKPREGVAEARAGHPGQGKEDRLCCVATRLSAGQPHHLSDSPLPIATGCTASPCRCPCRRPCCLACSLVQCRRWQACAQAEDKQWASSGHLRPCVGAWGQGNNRACLLPSLRFSHHAFLNAGRLGSAPRASNASSAGTSWPNFRYTSANGTSPASGTSQCISPGSSTPPAGSQSTPGPAQAHGRSCRTVCSSASAAARAAWPGAPRTAAHMVRRPLRKPSITFYVHAIQQVLVSTT